MELIFFIMVFFAVFILGAILYFFYWPFKIWLMRNERLSWQMSRKINRIYLVVLFAIVLIITYIGVFPGESFYADEFKKVTLRELPASADFVSKSASYPDFHGEYYSQSEIELSKADYKVLLKELKNDERITKTTERAALYGGDQDEKNIAYHFIRNNKDGRGPYQYIGFDNDGKTIYIDVSQN